MGFLQLDWKIGNKNPSATRAAAFPARPEPRADIAIAE
jgi:hypothetical protein